MQLNFRSYGVLALASMLVFTEASCQNLAHRLPPYTLSELATGRASAIAAAPDGAWFVSGDRSAWRITADGATASWELPWAEDGAAGLQKVAQIAISQTGRIALADPGASVVWDAGSLLSARSATGSGLVHLAVLAGTGTGFYPIGDGALAITSQIDRPEGVAWDAAGDLFVSDTGHDRLRRVGRDGRIFTLVGRGFPEPIGDGGEATAAGLSRPAALAVSKTGDVVTADFGHERVRTVSSGVIRTIASFPARGLAVDGEGTIFASGAHDVEAWAEGDRTIVATGLHAPTGLAVNARGQVAVADGDRVVLLTPGR